MRFEDHPVTSKDYKRAKDLRHQSSPFEKNVWFALRQACKPRKIKFRRQQPIHPYIVDFVCMEAKLVIELDGMSHDTQQAYDRKRDDYLRQHGYTVLRFTNEEARDNLSGIIEVILAEAEKLLKKFSI